MDSTTTQAAPVAQPVTAPVTQSTDTQPSFVIPQEYQGRGWTEKIKSPDDLFKAYDNAQSLLGKRPAGIPANDAPAEEWEKYYNSARPESADKYEFSKVEGLPEGFDVAPFEAKAKALAHKIGLTPKQANDMWNNYLSMEIEGVGEATKQSTERQAQLDKEFDDLSSKLFGDQFDTHSKQAQDFLAVALPDELKPIVGELADNPRALAALVQVSKYANEQINATKQKYGAEDKLASGGQNANMSQDEVRNSLVQAKQKAASHAPFSPERKAAEAEIERLRSSLTSMLK